MLQLIFNLFEILTGKSKPPKLEHTPSKDQINMAELREMDERSQETHRLRREAQMQMMRSRFEINEIQRVHLDAIKLAGHEQQMKQEAFHNAVAQQYGGDW